MVNLNTVIQYLFPGAEPLRDYLVRDDGNGQYLADWHLPDPKPNPAQLAAAADEAELFTLRAKLRTKINEWRDDEERGSVVFPHAGHTWDGGLAVRQRMKPLLALQALPDGFYWTDADDNDVPTTLPELQALDAAHEAAIVTQGWAIHTRQRDMKAEIESLDAATLAKYIVGWPAPELPE